MSMRLKERTHTGPYRKWAKVPRTLVQSAVAFAVSSLFAAGEPGFHAETYNPDSLLQRTNRFFWTEDFTKTTYWTFGNVSGTATQNGNLFTFGASAIDRINSNTGAGVVTSIVGDVFTIGFKLSGSGDVRLQAIYGNGNGATLAAITLTSTPTWYYQTFTNTFAGSLTGGGVYNNAAGVAGASVLVEAACFRNGTAVIDDTTYQKVTDWYTEYMAASLSRIGMWQESTGTTPVTAVEQPVGLWKDTKTATVLGANINPDPNFGSPGDWVNTGGSGSWTIAGNVATAAAANLRYVYINSSATSGTFYQVDVVVDSVTAGSVYVFAGTTGTARTLPITTPGTYSYTVLANSATRIGLYGEGFTGVVSSMTMRPIPGNHAIQATSASRPTLSARYNLLTKTEQLNVAPWVATSVTVASGATDPNSGSTAWTLTASAVSAELNQPITSAPAGTYKIYVKRRTGTGLIYLVNGTVPTYTSIAVTSSWQEFTVTSAATGTCYFGIAFQMSGDAVDVWHPDMRSANDASLSIPAYQRVNTSTDYDTSGFIHYLKFDGVDDSLSTPAINFSAANKMTVWAGAGKTGNDTSGGQFICELSNDSSGVVGTFGVDLNGAAANGAHIGTFTYGASSTIADASAGSSVAPYTAVITTQHDLAAASATTACIIRKNGSVLGYGTTAGVSPAGGNFAAAQPLRIGARAGTTLWLTGRMTSLTTRGTTTASTATQVSQMESYVATRAGVTL